MVAIEFGMCRSGRSGGAPWPITFGNGRRLEQRGGTRSRGGNRFPLADQESVGCDAQRGVMVKASPSTALKMAEPDFLLEVLIIALDAPAQLGQIDQTMERGVCWNRREPVFGWLALALGPLDQQPFFRAALGEIVIAMGSTNANPRKA